MSSSPWQSRLPDPGAALAAYREGAVTVLASDPLRPGSACLLAALETLQPETLSRLRGFAHGLISVLLPEHQRYGVRLFLSGADCAITETRGPELSGTTPCLDDALALCAFLRELAYTPAGAEHEAAAFGSPFVTLSGAGTLNWPDSERVVSALAARLDLVDAALICSLHDARGRCIHGDEVIEFAATHGLPLLYPDDAVHDVRLIAAG